MTRFLSLSLTLIACSTDGPALGQFGEDESLFCAVVSETPVGREDAASTLDPIVAGPHTAEMAWGSETASITVSVSEAAGGPVRLTYEARDNGQELETPPDGLCAPRIRVPVSVSVDSDDGRLDEAFDADLLLDPVEQYAYLDARLSAPTGTVDPVALYDGADPIETDAIQIHLAFLGTFSGSISPVRSDDPDDDVSTLGAWPVDEETL